MKQVKGTEGYDLMKPFDVYIHTDWEYQQFIINNAPFTSYVKIQKTDAESGLAIPYAGAAFQIYNPDGTKVSMEYTYPEHTIIDTFYTNEDGYLITPESLGYGKGYYLVEVSAPYFGAGGALGFDTVSYTHLDVYKRQVIFRADGGNHFTDYGIYEGMFLFFDRKKRFKKGRLSCYINTAGDDRPKYRGSDKNIDGYKHLGRLVLTLRNYEV